MKLPSFALLVVTLLSPLLCFAEREPTTPSQQRPTLFPIYLEEDFKDGRYHQTRGWGYISDSGRVIITQRFTGAGHFSEGLAPVRVTLTPHGSIANLDAFRGLDKITGQPMYRTDDSIGKWGFIDEVGTVVIKFQFDEASTFSEGLARVKLGGKFGFVDKLGTLAISPQFDSVGRFAEGLAVVHVGDKCGYINSKGQVVIQPQFDAASSFAESRAAVRIGKLYGYIDHAGRVVIEPQFSEVGRFSERLAKAKLKEKWGYIDKGGKFVINAQFDDAGTFTEDLAEVRIGHKWGYINGKGEPVIAAQFDEAYPFSDGLASVKIKDRWGYITKGGKIWVYPVYLSATPFYKGVGIVTQMRYETGYSERTGEALTFEYLTWKYIDRQGRVLAEQYGHRQNLGASGSGPDTTYATIDINLISRPTGATVYLVPLYDWENDSDMVNDDRKLSPYRVSQGNTDVQTFQPEKVFKGVFVLNSQRIAIDVDVVSGGNINFKVDFK